MSCISWFVCDYSFNLCSNSYISHYYCVQCRCYHMHLVRILVYSQIFTLAQKWTTHLLQNYITHLQNSPISQPLLSPQSSASPIWHVYLLLCYYLLLTHNNRQIIHSSCTCSLECSSKRTLSTFRSCFSS